MSFPWEPERGGIGIANYLVVHIQSPGGCNAKRHNQRADRARGADLQKKPGCQPGPGNYHEKFWAAML